MITDDDMIPMLLNAEVSVHRKGWKQSNELYALTRRPNQNFFIAVPADIQEMDGDDLGDKIGNITRTFLLHPEEAQAFVDLSPLVGVMVAYQTDRKVRTVITVDIWGRIYCVRRELNGKSKMVDPPLDRVTTLLVSLVTTFAMHMPGAEEVGLRTTLERLTEANR